MIVDLKEQQNYIRELGKQLKEISSTEENGRKRQRWADHNDLIIKQSPLLWVCPDDDGGWLELVPINTLKCQNNDLRKLELQLKKYLYHAKYINDDFVFESRVYFNIPGKYTGYLYGDSNEDAAWGVSIVKPHAGKNAYHLDNFLKTDEDFDKLLNHEVDFIPDKKECIRLKNLYEDTLDGILEVEFHLPYSVLVQSLLIELVHLRGLEELMFDLYDYPERTFQVLKHMGESKARLLDRLEKEHMLFDNRINIYTGSGSLGYTNAPRKKPEEVKLSDMWGFADAQEFSKVSPKMFEEFAIVNQKIGLNKFGRGCYGCCEPLDDKYDAIYKHITNIRRLSVSPWSDIPLAVENIGQKAIFSWKPNPVKICTGFDEDEMFHYLKQAAELTGNCFMEIILKDIRTCGNTNRHIIKFIELVNKAFNRA